MQTARTVVAWLYKDRDFNFTHRTITYSTLCSCSQTDCRMCYLSGDLHLRSNVCFCVLWQVVVFIIGQQVCYGISIPVVAVFWFGNVLCFAWSWAAYG